MKTRMMSKAGLLVLSFSVCAATQAWAQKQAPPEGGPARAFNVPARYENLRGFRSAEMRGARFFVLKTKCTRTRERDCGMDGLFCLSLSG